MNAHSQYLEMVDRCYAAMLADSSRVETAAVARSLGNPAVPPVEVNWPEFPAHFQFSLNTCGLPEFYWSSSIGLAEHFSDASQNGGRLCD